MNEQVLAQPVADFTLHPLEQLVATNPDAEIWWDSSPLIFPSWRQETLAKAPEGKRADWTAQVDRFYDAEVIASKGEMGFRGVTTNPPLSLQAIKLAPEVWAGEIRKIAAQNPDLDYEGVYWAMYLDLVKKGAEAIRPVWEKSGGRYGWLSGQVDPRWVRDGEKMLKQGLEIVAQGPNVMLKLPGSKEGYEVMEEVTARGISTNNTTSFTVAQYSRCMSAITAGLQRARAAGVDVSKHRSVITHMSARLGELSDWKTEAKARGIELTLPEIRDGEEAVLKRAYHYGKSINHPSKMLQCSMRVEKDERTGQTCSRHIQDFAGSDMVFTCPPGYIAQLMAVEGELAPFEPNAIDREPNKASIDKLMKLPSFRQAYEFDGMTPDQFAHFGSFKATETEFAAATRQTVDFVRMTMEFLRAPVPPFTAETAALKVRAAEDAWNRRDPDAVSLAYTPDSRWRNRSEFLHGREAIVAFLQRKWSGELDYRLIKELWAFSADRIAVRFAYEWHDAAGQWFRSYGNENWRFDAAGYMAERHASINDVAIAEAERLFRWAQGPRPADHPGLSELGL